MINKMNSIKRTARKYVFPAIVGGMVTLANVNYVTANENDYVLTHQNNIESKLASEVGVNRKPCSSDQAGDDWAKHVGWATLPLVGLVVGGLFWALYVRDRDYWKEEGKRRRRD